MLQVAAFSTHMARKRRDEINREAQTRVIIVCEIGDFEYSIDCSLLTKRSELEQFIWKNYCKGWSGVKVISGSQDFTFVKELVIGQKVVAIEHAMEHHPIEGCACVVL